MMGVLATGAVGLSVAGAAAVGWRERQARRVPWEHLRCAVSAGYRPEPGRLIGALAELWAAQRSHFRQVTEGPVRFSFEIVATHEGVVTLWSAPAPLIPVLGATLAHSYGDKLQLTPAEDPIPAKTEKGWGPDIMRLKLARPSAYALSGFDEEVISSVQHRMTTLLHQGELVILQIVLEPLKDSAPWPLDMLPLSLTWKQQALDELRRAMGRKGRLERGVDGTLQQLGLSKGLARRPEGPDPHQRLLIQDTPKKLQGHGFAVSIRIIARAADKGRRLSLCKQMYLPFSRLNDANRLVPDGRWRIDFSWDHVRRRLPDPGPPQVLTPAELSSLVPVQVPKTEGATVRMFTKIPEVPDGFLVGYAEGITERQMIRLAMRDLRQHLMVNGSTGTGKTTLFTALAGQVIKRDVPLFCIDPLGGFAEGLLTTIPRDRWDSVLYIEPGNPDWAWPMNFLKARPGQEEAVAERTLNLFRRIAADGWGPATDDMIFAAAEAAIADGGTLLELRRALTSPAYREHVLGLVRNPETREVLREFDGESKGNTSMSRNISAPLNKVRQLLRRRALRLLLCHDDCVDLRDIVEGRSPIKVVIVNLNKGRIGQMAARALGGAFLGLLEATFLERSVKEGNARQAIIILDELRDLVDTSKTGNEALDTMLTQVRQKGGGVVMGEQFLSQLGNLEEAIKSCCNTKIALRSSSADADMLGRLIKVPPTEIEGAANFQGYARAMVAGQILPPCTFYVPDPLPAVTGDWRELAEHSCRRYARPAAEVEREIQARYAEDDEADGILEANEAPDDLVLEEAP